MAPEKTLSLDQALTHGWEKMKKHFWFLSGIIGISIAISLVFSICTNLLSARSTETIPMILYTVLSIVNFIISLIISIGTIKIYLKITDGETAEYRDLFRYSKYIWKYLAVSILLGLLVVAGLILLIFPGIYWGIRYRFAPFLIIDKNMGVFDAFRKSAEMTQGVMWSLFAFGSIELAIAMIGILVLFIGIIPASWIIGLAHIFIYRKLAGKSKAKEMVETPATAE